MGKQTIVRVNKVESYRDLNGSLGKKIELIEEHEDHSKNLVPDEIQAVIAQVQVVLQQTIPQMQMQIPVMPKMILFLTEAEYDDIGIPLDVNQTYTVTFEGQAIKFNKKYEQYVGRPLTPLTPEQLAKMEMAKEKKQEDE